MNVLKEYFRLLLLASLSVVILPANRRRGRNRNEIEDFSRKEECPKLRFRRRGCSYRYECKEECTEKKDCKTTYQYKCKEYRKQECKNVWQNQCRGKKSRRRGRRSARRPYWLDRNNIEVIYNSQDFPLQPSDVPFADEGADAGATYSFASPPKSRSCWKRVRQCEWKKYKTSCQNVPTTTCNGTKQECRKRCKNRWYCDQCPKPTTPKPRPPVGPTRPTRPPSTVKPTPALPGPPAPPPAGAFIGPPGVPINLDPEQSVIDARLKTAGLP